MASWNLPQQELAAILRLLVILAFSVSFMVPFLAWRLKRRSVISLNVQRKVEISWLTTFVILAVVAWVIWVIDRTASDPTLVVFVSCVVFIVLGLLGVSASRRWRIGKCLTGHSLLKVLLLIAIHAALFYACFFITLVVGLSLLISSDAHPLAVAFLPDWVFLVIQTIAIVLYLAVAFLLRTGLRRRLGITQRGTARSPMVHTDSQLKDHALKL